VGLLKHRSTIAAWISEEARRRGHVVTESNATQLLMAAFRESKKEKVRSKK